MIAVYAAAVAVPLLVAMYFIKLGRAEEAGEWDVALKIDQALRCNLKELKMTKIAREGDEPSGTESTPAEWATSLLQEWDKSRRAKQVRKLRTSKVKDTANNSNDDASAADEQSHIGARDR